MAWADTWQPGVSMATNQRNAAYANALSSNTVAGGLIVPGVSARGINQRGTFNQIKNTGAQALDALVRFADVVAELWDAFAKLFDLIDLAISLSTIDDYLSMIRQYGVAANTNAILSQQPYMNEGQRVMSDGVLVSTNEYIMSTDESGVVIDQGGYTDAAYGGATFAEQALPATIAYAGVAVADSQMYAVRASIAQVALDIMADKVADLTSRRNRELFEHSMSEVQFDMPREFRLLEDKWDELRTSWAFKYGKTSGLTDWQHLVSFNNLPGYASVFDNKGYWGGVADFFGRRPTPYNFSDLEWYAKNFGTSKLGPQAISMLRPGYQNRPAQGKPLGLSGPNYKNPFGGSGFGY